MNLSFFSAAELMNTRTLTLVLIPLALCFAAFSEAKPGFGQPPHYFTKEGALDDGMFALYEMSNLQKDWQQTSHSLLAQFHRMVEVQIELKQTSISILVQLERIANALEAKTSN